MSDTPKTDDFYQMPKHGWTCFFCGDTFTTPGAARDHFGNDLNSTVACKIKAGDERGLVMELRKAEAELNRYRNEDSDKDREFYAMRSAHAQALLREEEKGYERGLKDYSELNDELAAANAQIAALRDELAMLTLAYDSAMRVGSDKSRELAAQASPSVATADSPQGAAVPVAAALIPGLERAVEIIDAIYTPGENEDDLSGAIRAEIEQAKAG